MDISNNGRAANTLLCKNIQLNKFKHMEILCNIIYI